MPQNRLMVIRNARGLTQQQLADKLNTSHVTVGRWEKQDQRLDIPTLTKLARLLDCTIGQLVGETPFAAGGDAAPREQPLERDRLAKVVDALDHYLAENKLKIVPGGRSDLLLAIYDWSVDQKLPVEKIGDLSGIRSLLRPLTK